MPAKSRAWPAPTLLLVARAFGYCFHYVVEIEAAGFLAWRKFAEALQPLADIGAGWREHEHVVHPPFIVADAFIPGDLERIHAQISQHRRPQCCEWLCPGQPRGGPAAGK